MSRNNEKIVLIDLGELNNEFDFAKFDFTPPYSKKIKRAGLVSQTYNEVSLGHEFELSIHTDNKKNHLGRFPVKIGKDATDENNHKFLNFDLPINCAKNISGFVRAIADGSLRDVKLLIVFEK